MKQDILNLIALNEDKVRAMRNQLDPLRRSRYATSMSAGEGYVLAAAVADGLQAIREALQLLTTSSWRD
jgi:hypothetical protein